MHELVIIFSIDCKDFKIFKLIFKVILKMTAVNIDLYQEWPTCSSQAACGSYHSQM